MTFGAKPERPNLVFRTAVTEEGATMETIVQKDPQNPAVRLPQEQIEQPSQAATEVPQTASSSGEVPQPHSQTTLPGTEVPPRQGQTVSAEGEGNSVETRESSAKAEAKRANSRRPTGPRTIRGKNLSRLNAIKHGILATQTIVFDEEYAEEFSELVETLLEHFEPFGKFEQNLVNEIATTAWRLRRAVRYERAAMSQTSIHNYLTGDDMERILRYETSLSRRYNQLLNQLERMQRQRLGEDVPLPARIIVTRE